MTATASELWHAGKYFERKPLDESRQHYATVRTQEMQRAAIRLSDEVLPLDFSELLRAFRMFGDDYDRGARLRDDSMEGAA